MLEVDGAVKVAHDFDADALSDGRFGMGTDNAVAHFDNLQACVFASFPYAEGFNDGVADHMRSIAGDWVVNGSGQYAVTTTADQDGLSLVALDGALPEAFVLWAPPT